MDCLSGDVQLWSGGQRYYVGEPAFIPRGGNHRPSSEATDGSKQGEAAEDEGWLVALCYDASKSRSEFIIIDGRRVQDGPVAVLPLEDSIPHGMACFAISLSALN